MDYISNPGGYEQDYVPPRPDPRSVLIDTIINGKNTIRQRLGEVEGADKVMRNYSLLNDENGFMAFIRDAAMKQKVALDSQNGGQWHSLAQIGHKLMGPTNAEQIIRAATGISSTLLPDSLLKYGADAIQYGSIPNVQSVTPMMATPQLIKDIMEQMTAAKQNEG